MGKVEIIHCRGCGNEIASIAKHCPYCGVKQIRKKSAIPPFLLGAVLTLAAVTGAFFWYNQDDPGIIIEVFPPLAKVIPRNWLELYSAGRTILTAAGQNADTDQAGDGRTDGQTGAARTWTAGSGQGKEEVYDNGIFSFTYDENEFFWEEKENAIAISARELPDSEDGRETVLGVLEQPGAEDASPGSSEMSEEFIESWLADMCHTLFLTNEGDSVITENVDAAGCQGSYEMTMTGGISCYARCMYQGETVYVAICRLCPYSESLNGGYKRIYDSITFTENPMPSDAAAPQTKVGLTKGHIQETNASSASNTAEGVSPEFKEWMDTYEAFMNEYMDLLTKYKANPSDISILGEYASMIQKYYEYQEQINRMNESNMSQADYQYFMESYARIMDRFADFADVADGSAGSGSYGDMLRDLSDLYGALGQIGEFGQIAGS